MPNKSEHYRGTQMARIIKLALIVNNEPRTWTRPMLAEHLEVDKATIQRYVNLLREIGIEIKAVGKQGYEMSEDFFVSIKQLTPKPERLKVCISSR